MRLTRCLLRYRGLAIRMIIKPMLIKSVCYRFLVSRHPYTRVVAFYHHSLLKSNKRSLNWPKMLQDAGIKEMHIRDDKLLSEKGLPSFTNFIRYLNNNNGVVRLENPITEHIDKQVCKHNLLIGDSIGDFVLDRPWPPI